LCPSFFPIVATVVRSLDARISTSDVRLTRGRFFESGAAANRANRCGQPILSVKVIHYRFTPFVFSDPFLAFDIYPRRFELEKRNWIGRLVICERPVESVPKARFGNADKQGVCPIPRSHGQFLDGERRKISQ
jgi:hypothetical protein